jgi:hypothetical protein
MRRAVEQVWSRALPFATGVFFGESTAEDKIDDLRFITDVRQPYLRLSAVTRSRRL